jgi:hypothetical protein
LIADALRFDDSAMISLWFSVAGKSICCCIMMAAGLLCRQFCYSCWGAILRCNETWTSFWAVSWVSLLRCNEKYNWFWRTEIHSGTSWTSPLNTETT